MQHLSPLLPLACVVLSGCGATTLRVDLAPTLDSTGQAGFESTFSMGLGMPLDYSGRSHHYAQVAAGIGGGAAGGIEPEAASGVFISDLALNYIYWAEPSMDVHAGLRFAYRGVPNVDAAPNLYSVGGHLALLPVVLGSDSNWMVAHLVVGPEFRLEKLWSSRKDQGRAMFSLPLVIALDLLGAGD